MKLPKQAPPVKRSVHRMAEVGSSGVVPCGFLDVVKDVASVAGPIASAALPALASAI